MARKLKLITPIGQVDIVIENLSGKAEPRKVNGKDIEMKPDGSPKIIYRNVNGDLLSFCRVLNGEPIKESLNNGYTNEQGELFTNSEALPYFVSIDGEEIEAPKNEATEVFEIKWNEKDNFTDKYLLDKFYQVKPSSGDTKKEAGKKISIIANTIGLKKIWDYMIENNVIGKGQMNITSAGYLPSYAFLRPVKLNGSKWTFEIAVFKQQKQFSWVEELSFKAIMPEMATKKQKQAVIEDI